WEPDDGLAGKRILVRAEQGLGDMIQFVRFAPLLHGMGARVFLSVHRPLAALLGTVDGVEQVCVLGREASLPQMDCWIPALSVPRCLRIDEKTIPAAVPYLRTDPALRRKWADRLRRHGATRRIGIAWSGSPTHNNDRYRSMAPGTLATLARAVARADTVYFGLGEARLPEAARRSGLLPLGPLADFAELAALVEQLDLVITVDTAFAHLAGALARPVWVLLPLNCDWRWLRERSDSAWYPTMRLYRQRALGDWSGVMEQVARDLDILAASSKAA
ncbi:MAG: glycosyltransferase family 9 protein, partial [Betaproteobacteria bacterium]